MEKKNLNRCITSRRTRGVDFKVPIRSKLPPVYFYKSRRTTPLKALVGSFARTSPDLNVIAILLFIRRSAADVGRWSKPGRGEVVEQLNRRYWSPDYSQSQAVPRP